MLIAMLLFAMSYVATPTPFLNSPQDTVAKSIPTTTDGKIRELTTPPVAIDTLTKMLKVFNAIGKSTNLSDENRKTVVSEVQRLMAEELGVTQCDQMRTLCNVARGMKAINASVPVSADLRKAGVTKTHADNLTRELAVFGELYLPKDGVALR